MENWLQSALDSAGMTQAQLSREMTKLLGRSIDRAAINKLAKQKRRMQADELLAIVRITGADPPPEYLTDRDTSNLATLPLPTGRVPYGGEVQAGAFLAVDEYFNQDVGDELVPPGVIRHPGFPKVAQHAWRVHGDSMDLANIRDGMWIVGGSYSDYVDQIGELANGQFVIVERTRHGGSERELTVKEVQFARRGMRLIPRSSNQKYSEFFIALDTDADPDTEQVRILAVVLSAVQDFVFTAR